MQSITVDGDDDEESMMSPEEMFGKNYDFVMSRMYSGRPNWNYLFNYWASLYQKESMNVYSCGPKPLNKEVHKICRNYNKRGFNFKYLHEAFSS
jgi:Ferric reductase NAD binding domain